MSSLSRSKKAVISVISIISAAGICFGTMFVISKNAEQVAAEPAYREYTAVKSNITVGISESGTAAVNRSYLSFPVSAEVEEVYVKVGSSVKKGDKIAKLSADDVDEVKAQYESQISAAKLELETAVTESKTKLAQAENTYKSSLAKSGSAEETYRLSVTKLQSDISDAEKNIAELKKQLAEYEALSDSYSDDYGKYSEYDGKYSEYEDTYESYKDTYERYEKTLKEYEKELTAAKEEYDEYLESVEDDWNNVTQLQKNAEQAKSALDEASKALEKANSSDGSTDADSASADKTGGTSQSTDSSLTSAQKKYDEALEDYNEACAAYGSPEKSLYLTIEMRKEEYEKKVTAAEDKIEDYKEMMEEYSEMMSDYSKEMSKYKSEFDEYDSDYKEIYGNMDGEDIAEKISSLKDDIEKAEYELEKLTLNAGDSEFSAEQDKNNAILGASTAKETYDQTVAQINRSVSDKRESLEKLEKEYNTLLENMGGGIYIYADCDGAVASVNISAGNTIGANQTVASIMDSSEVYVSVSVSEDDIAALSVGQAASVTLSAYEGVTIDGEVDTIAVEPSRSSGSVSYAVSVKINPSENITVYEGMTCDVTFLQKQVSNVVYVNVQAVRYKGNGVSAVLVYDENGDVAEREVVTGFSDGRYVEIVSGLSAGDTVLAESSVIRS
ncbi:MAG: efflux RND transporter periplasmic adaptor subunit [Prevotella sp.]|nr:efflux RND transporter periplasmic adaptor subunit [Prevotella sp.]